MGDYDSVKKEKKKKWKNLISMRQTGNEWQIEVQNLKGSQELKIIKTSNTKRSDKIQISTVFMASLNGTVITDREHKIVQHAINTTWG